MKYPEILKTLNIKKSDLGFGVAGIIALILSYPSFQKYQVSTEQIRSDVAQKEASASKAERELEYEQRQQEIANKRYANCLPVVGQYIKNGTHYFTGIKEGETPIDRITNNTFPRGTVVCDALGTTGSIDENGAIANTAYTGDRDVVAKRLKRFRGSQFSQPVIKEGE
jgi:hypothetical protein